MDGHPAFQTANDTILVPGPKFIEATTNFTVEDIADATTDFIRIRQWEGRESRFMQYALDTMVSGTVSQSNRHSCALPHTMDR
jgi:hypothetical protein